MIVRKCKQYLGICLVIAMILTEFSGTKVLAESAQTTGDTEYSMDIDVSNTGATLSENLVGLFFEDINNSADGGLNPQMVKNNSFENYSYQGGSRVDDFTNQWQKSGTGSFTISTSGGLNENNPNFATLNGDMVLSNNGYTPIDSQSRPSMAVKNGVAIDFSVFTKTSSDYTGTMKAKLVDSNGAALTNEITIQPAKTGEWVKVTGILNGLATGLGRLILTVQGSNNGTLNIDMVSLSPVDTYGYGDTNYGYGAGLRKDLVERIKALNPGFIRFPGGCIIEGAYEWDTYYDWENTIGSLEERKSIPNLWGNDTSYGYMQSYGLGYHEMLQLCEDINAEPYPIMNAGILCQARSDYMDAASGALLDSFVKDITDLMDYCWGDATTNAMAAKRVQNGHEDPFNLNYIGIGNENFSEKYFQNFDYIYEKVIEYRDTYYTGHPLTIIAAAGTAADDYNNQNAWNWINQNHKDDDILVDEHYYVDENFSMYQDDRYDYFLREEDGGTPVFLGEYATRLYPANSLESALSDAAYMTGVERNSDIVKSVSYAPLFNKVGSTNWETDLIWFDEFNSIGSINYYVQQLFSQNHGNLLVNSLLEKQGERYTQNTGSPILGTWQTKGYIDSIKITREDGTVLLNETFDDNSTTKDLWEAFPDSDGSFSISNGKLYLSNNADGLNAVYLPSVIDNTEWHDYKVEAVVVKESGQEGFLVGAGTTTDYYWYNIGGWGDSRNVVERIHNGMSGRMVIGNKHEWMSSYYYSTPEYTNVPVNQSMNVTFSYGVGDKLEAGYVSGALTQYQSDYSMNLRPYQSDIYNVVTKDDNYVYVKLVNTQNKVKAITLNLENIPVQVKTADLTTLKGTNLSTANTMSNESTVPVQSNLDVSDNKIVYNIPAYSVNVIKISLKESAVTTDQPTAISNSTQTTTSTSNTKTNETTTTTNQAIQTGDNTEVIPFAMILFMAGSILVVAKTKKKSDCN